MHFDKVWNQVRLHRDQHSRTHGNEEREITPRLGIDQHFSSNHRQDTAMEVIDSHVAADTARAVEETAKMADQTVQAAQDTARQIHRTAPETFKSARKGAAKTRKAADATARQAKSKVKKGAARLCL
jgi:hypothetical protein